MYSPTQLLLLFGWLLVPGLRGEVLGEIGEKFESEIRPLLAEHCLQCHGGEKVKGKVDFSKIRTLEEIEDHFELWKQVEEVVTHQDMPPEDEAPLSESDRSTLLGWIEDLKAVPVEAQPSVFRPRRLSGPEYRNTLRSLFGFDLKVTIAKAEQTFEGETSLVLKLLPTDPPGASGFVNDTHAAPISTHMLDQYSTLASAALEEIFTKPHRAELSRMIGRELGPKWKPTDFTHEDASSLIQHFVPRALRRPVEEARMGSILEALDEKSGEALVSATKFELKAVLLSPAFLYRGLLVEGEPATQVAVDSFEYAERLSFFLWGTGPDEALAERAALGGFEDRQILADEIRRMLASPKARYLSEQFGAEWLGLGSIDDLTKRDPIRHRALTTQPRDFLHYLFTEERPIMELIDSRVAFANDNTAAMYGKDREQMKKIPKPRGIERWATPNQRLELEKAEGRGGILTEPAVLAMNRGPILRGTWMLEKILGQHLGDPPADVPPVKASPRGKQLSFRERFEAHRDNASCARCHEKIDPLGFALDGYDANGVFLLASDRKPPKNQPKNAPPIDTSGRLPGGEEFADFAELKQILMTTRREEIVGNVVERALSFALCRKLGRHDQPVVEEITKQMLKKDGTWEELFVEIALSLPFRETRFESDE